MELGESPLPAEWLAEDELFTLSDWFLSETAISFEKGLITANEFALLLKKELKLDASAESIIEQFTQWPVGLFPGSEQLLQSLIPRYRLAALSNTNELHWPRLIHEFKLYRFFESIFASHLLQMTKPEPDIFKCVIHELNVAPECILFFDDNMSNIEVAKEYGIHAVYVKGIEQVRQSLVIHGIAQS